MSKRKYKGFNKYRVNGSVTIILTKHKNKNFEILIDSEQLENLIKLNYCWHVGFYKKKNGYCAKTNIKSPDTKSGKTTPKLQNLIMQSNEIIDHINGDTLDYRKENLRFANKSQNSKNRTRTNSNNTSGYRNVTWINDIKSNSYRLHILELWKKDFLRRVEFDEKINSFVKNVIVAHYRNNIVLNKS